MLKRFKRLNECGDTIVEVMIVLAILGLAIGICYSTANRSLLNSRQAQENTEATELARTQAELLRAGVPNDATYGLISAAYADFCFEDSGPKIGDYAAFTSGTCTKGAPTNYEIRLTRCNGNPDKRCTGLSSDNNYLIVVTWDDILGNGKDTVTLAYRVHRLAP